MRCTVEEFIKSCRTCQQMKAHNRKPYGLPEPIKPPESKWEAVTMDFVIPLPETAKGNSCILNVVRKLSKMIRIIPIKSNKSLHEQICTALLTSFAANLALSTACHPQTDGQSEIAIRKVEEMIRPFANYKKDNWAEHLVDFELAYNSAVNSTTLCRPFFVNYGVHPKIVPLETLSSHNPSAKSFMDTIHDTTKFAYDRITKQNRKMAEYANKSRIPHDFKVNDLVWLSTKNLSVEDGSGIRKLHPKFCEPFKTTKKIYDVAFKLELSEPMKARGIHDALHCSLLRPYNSDTFGRYDKPLPPIQIQDGIKYEVEAILHSKLIRRKSQFLVKWKGIGDHENTWQTRKDLHNSPELLHEYKTSMRRSP